jgi:hypothetical protein
MYWTLQHLECFELTLKDCHRLSFPYLVVNLQLVYLEHTAENAQVFCLLLALFLFVCNSKAKDDGLRSGWLGLLLF